MLRKKSISTTPFIVTFIIAIFLTLQFGAFITAREFFGFRMESKRMREQLLSTRKADIQREVEDVFSFISYQASTTERRLKKEIRGRTYEAHAVMTRLHGEYAGKLADADLKAVVKDALRDIRFNGGRGYYFATNLNGIEELFPDRPELEGTNLLNLTDTEGKYVIREVIRIAHDTGEGFSRYSWTKPKEMGRSFPKISFIKLFEPFGWLVGTGEYLDNVARDIQGEVVKRIQNIRYGEDGYIFVFKPDGELVAHGAMPELIGKNSLKDLGPAIGAVSEKMIRKAKGEGGGFFRYSWKKPSTERFADKLVYVKYFKEWDWIIATGVYMDDIDRAIEGGRTALQSEVREEIALLLLVLFANFALILLTGRYFSSRIRKGFDSFARFFRRTAKTFEYIEAKNLEFTEFEKLSHLANRMVDERKKARKKLDRQQRQLMEAEKMAALGQLVAGVAHEINTPVGIGVTTASFLSDQTKKLQIVFETGALTRSQFAAFLDATEESSIAILENLARASELIESFKQVAVDQSVEEMRTFALCEYLRGTIRHLHPLYRNSGHTVTLDGPEALLITSYPGAFSQIITNLVTNSLTHAFEGASDGQITIDVSTRSGNLTLRYRDNGSGMPEDTLKKVFEPFFTTRRNRGGTGLGMHIVFNLVSRTLGGTITAASRPGNGTTFSIRIPLKGSAENDLSHPET